MCLLVFKVFIVLVGVSILSAIKLDFFPKHGENIIWFNHKNDDEINRLETEVDQKLKDYKDPKNKENLMECDFNYGQRSDLICVPTNPQHFQPCTKENHYGYSDGTPCVFVTIKKKLGWVPIPYDDLTTLPGDMPQEIKVEIAKRARERPEALNTIWITCEGDHPADRENIGTITYLPDRGFNGYYFPYKNIEGYLSPLVVLLFNNPQRNILINIKCKIWAKNINYQGDNRDGTLQFELMVD